MFVPVLAIRLFALLAFVGPMLFFPRGRRLASRGRTAPGGGVAVRANLLASALFLLILLLFPGNPEAPAALPLALSGAALALAGAAIVGSARAALGRAWSLEPRADLGAGLVTSGPDRNVRHPIYAGFVVLATGQALAFSSWPALLLVLAALIPTFAWRARVEERLLQRAFGDTYANYRRRTTMMIPYLL